MKRLLLVEDDDDIRQIANIVLRRRFEVAEAPDGEAALRVGSSFQPQVVLMDLMMPGLDGVETLRRMRGTDWGQTIVAILMTARAVVDGPTRGIEDFASVISKPFDPLQLEQLVEEALP